MMRWSVMDNSRLIIGAAVLGTLISASGAQAARQIKYSNTLPPALFETSIYFLSTAAFAPISNSNYDSTAFTQLYYYGPFKTPDPYVRVNVTPTIPQGQSGAFFEADADVTYFFKIDRPSGDLAPFDVYIEGDFLGGDVNQVTGASVTVSEAYVGTVASVSQYQPGLPPTKTDGEQPFRLNFSVNPSDLYYVQVDASSNGCATLSPDEFCGVRQSFYSQGTYTSGVDPALTIDPSLPSGSYTLSYSANLAPPGAVPEPSSWAMMLLGLSGLGGLTRVRRAIS